MASIKFIKLFFLLFFIQNAITIDLDTKYFDLRLKDTLITKNQSDTIYICQGFQAPLGTYDLIAFESLVANKLVVHHMILFACDSNVYIELEPHLCITSKAFSNCLQWVVQWSIGMPTLNEVYEESGLRVGNGYSKLFYLQVHLDIMADKNQSEIIENSGFRIYYTDELRKYVASSVQIGQESIEIPPFSDQFLVQGGCSSTCTEFLFDYSNITHIYLNRIYLHMHQLGVKAELYLVNESEKTEKMLISDESYNYVQPKVHLFGVNNKILVKRGDTLLLKCYFNSNSGERLRNQTVTWGNEAKAEMCYAFITYYPKIEKFNKCTKKQEKDVCGY